jgi:transposase
MTMTNIVLHLKPKAYLLASRLERAARHLPHIPKPYTKKRHKVENMFGRIKDWRRVNTRYDRCAHTLFSAMIIADIVLY